MKNVNEKGVKDMIMDSFPHAIDTKLENFESQAKSDAKLNQRLEDICQKMGGYKTKWKPRVMSRECILETLTDNTDIIENEVDLVELINDLYPSEYIINTPIDIPVELDSALDYIVDQNIHYVLYVYTYNEDKICSMTQDEILEFDNQMLNETLLLKTIKQIKRRDLNIFETMQVLEMFYKTGQVSKVTKSQILKAFNKGE